MSEPQEKKTFLGEIRELLALIKDLRVFLLVVLALVGGGGGATAVRTLFALLAGREAFADAGGADYVDVAEALRLSDSVSRKNDAPSIQHLKRIDTTIISIHFKLDVMMSDKQKHEADSLMRKALQNINYGGSP